MNHADAKKMVKLLADLFVGQLMTEKQVQYARDEFKAFEVADVERAIREHRGKFKFIEWPELLEACRQTQREAAERSRGATKAAVPATQNVEAEKWCDVRRRQAPYLQNAGDFEVIVRVHRGWWHRCPHTLSNRSAIENACVGLLIAHGMTEKSAADWTAAVFDPDPEYFRQCLENLRDGATPPDAFPQLDTVDATAGHYRACWEAVKQFARDVVSRIGGRLYVMQGARAALARVGVQPDLADEIARDCVELAPGERLPKTALVLRKVPAGGGQTSHEALVALAKVEHGGGSAAPELAASSTDARS